MFALGLWRILARLAGGTLTIGDYVLMTGALQGAQGCQRAIAQQAGQFVEETLACGDAYD